MTCFSKTSASSTEKGAALSAPSNVLVQGNVIARISTDPIEAEGAQRIAGNGRTLMPGLIDAHWHAMLIASTPAEAMGDVGFANLAAGDEATDTLMRGFTTVRDVGGPVFGLKRAIDEGIIEGPRIYPSGAMITVTSGHGDFRQLSDLPRTIGGLFTPMERNGGSIIVDSPDEVRLRAREQFMQGAALIKLTAGGGVSSPHSPLDVTTFTEPELRAAVEIAENWGTYVAAHAFTSDAIQKAIAAGVKCIEHGFLMDEADAKLIAEKDIWLSLQPLHELMRTGLPEGSVERAKADEVWPGIGRTYELAKKYKIKTAWGTDVLFSRAMATAAGRNSRLAHPLVHARRSARHGDRDQRRTAGAVRQAQSLSGKARCHRGRRACGPLARRRQSVGEHRPGGRSRQQLQDHHEGRRHLQEHADRVRNN